MAQYMLLLRDNPAVFAGYGAGEMQRIIEKYRAWRTSQPWHAPVLSRNAASRRADWSLSSR